MIPFRPLGLILVLVLLVGCATKSSVTVLTPTQAIIAAATKPEGVDGVFELQVLNTGKEKRPNGTWIYLNSEWDYRDQRCLTIRLMPPAITGLQILLGADPSEALKGKRLRVTGKAQRVTVYFYSNGIRSDSYYYQTQIGVTDPAQIVVLP